MKISSACEYRAKRVKPLERNLRFLGLHDMPVAGNWNQKNKFIPFSKYVANKQITLKILENEIKKKQRQWRWNSWQHGSSDIKMIDQIPISQLLRITQFGTHY